MVALQEAHKSTTQQAETVRPEEGESGGLDYSLAATVEDAIEAWRLVHNAYVRAGLIDGNRHELHTVPEAIGPHSIVIVGRHKETVASTMSCYRDNERGLPLDSVYKPELDALRSSGRRILEVGLFADRREQLKRSADGLFELMRHAFFYAIHSNCTDFVVGVHPRHARFYMAFFAFSQIGEEKDYLTVNDNRVVLLKMDIAEAWARNPLPRGLRYFKQKPVEAEFYNTRFGFDSDVVANSPIGWYLQEKAQAATAGAGVTGSTVA